MYKQHGRVAEKQLQELTAALVKQTLAKHYLGCLPAQVGHTVPSLKNVFICHNNHLLKATRRVLLASSQVELQVRVRVAPISLIKWSF